MSKRRPPRKIGRKRRTMAWALLFIGVLMAAVWAWSGRYQLDMPLGSSRWGCHITQGAIVAQRDFGAPRLFEVHALPRNPLAPTMSGWCWRPTQLWWINWTSTEIDLFDLYLAAVVRYGGSTVFVVIMLWPIPVLLWILAALFFRSGRRAHRRATANACPECGYPLTGLAANSPCPECGKSPRAKTV